MRGKRCWRIVGAYAAQPTEPDQAEAFLASVLALPGCDGLEIPYGTALFDCHDPRRWEAMPQGGHHVLTLVPATMDALRCDPQWGPASSSSVVRERYLDMLASAREAVEVARGCGQSVTAVELQSSPRGDACPAPSREALAETLCAAADWDWGSAALVVEHCDAYQASGAFAKGFLSLSDEIEAVLRASGSRTPVGISINWGRSVIETKQVDGPVHHIEQAVAAGVLQGLIISGTTGADGRYGPAFADSHAPLRSDDLSDGDPASLLTPELVVRARNAAGAGLLYDGVKVAARPHDAILPTRLRMVSQTLAALNSRDWCMSR